MGHDALQQALAHVPGPALSALRDFLLKQAGVLRVGLRSALVQHVRSQEAACAVNSIGLERVVAPSTTAAVSPVAPVTRPEHLPASAPPVGHSAGGGGRKAGDTRGRHFGSEIQLESSMRSVGLQMSRLHYQHILARRVTSSSSAPQMRQLQAPTPGRGEEAASASSMAGAETGLRPGTCEVSRRVLMRSELVLFSLMLCSVRFDSFVITFSDGCIYFFMSSARNALMFCGT